MKQCWRWFGPNDTVPLAALHQVGVEGIVTALHDFLPGEIWALGSIRQRIDLLAANNLTWDVVESLPVSEIIKTQSEGIQTHLDAYKASMKNLADCGITTICYNFMPILDWTRTQLRAPQPHGGTAMLFSLRDFAAFDLFILQRAGAEDDYTDAQIAAARQTFDELSSEERQQLQNNIIAGLPGSNDKWTLADVQQRLSTYDGIDADRLRQNLVDFLSEVVPVAEDLGIRMCCHPDDPPFPLLGLPRVMSSLNDYQYILSAVETPANGVTFCTGSLGVDASFDPVDFIDKLGHRIHFAHLRNTKRLPGIDQDRPDFFEAAHLEGDTDMAATVRALMAEQNKRKEHGRQDWEIPMRPDHGQELLSDLTSASMPGYPLIGRMRGLAELRGLMAAFS